MASRLCAVQPPLDRPQLIPSTSKFVFSLASSLFSVSQSVQLGTRKLTTIENNVSVRFSKPFAVMPQVRCWVVECENDSEKEGSTSRIPDSWITPTDTGFVINSIKDLFYGSDKSSIEKEQENQEEKEKPTKKSDEKAKDADLADDSEDNFVIDDEEDPFRLNIEESKEHKKKDVNPSIFSEKDPKESTEQKNSIESNRNKYNLLVLWFAFTPIPSYSIIASTYNAIISEFQASYKQYKNSLLSELRKRSKDGDKISSEELSRRIELFILPEPKPSDDIYERVQNCINEASINARTLEGRTLMHAAASVGAVELLKEMVMVGGDINIQDNQGLTPLILAVRCGRWKTVEEMLKPPLSSNPHLLTLKGSNVLHGIPLAKGDGVHVNDIIYNPTHSVKEQVEEVDDSKFVIDDEEIGAHLEKSKPSKEPRFISVVQTRFQVVNKLINDYGVDVNHISCTGFTPLHFAVLAMKRSNWQLQFAEMLLKVGASPNFSSSNNLTPFMYSIDSRNMALIDLMIKYGGDPDLYCGETNAVIIANDTKNEEIIRKVEERSTFPVSHLRKKKKQNSTKHMLKVFANKHLKKVTSKIETAQKEFLEQNQEISKGTQTIAGTKPLVKSPPVGRSRFVSVDERDQFRFSDEGKLLLRKTILEKSASGEIQRVDEMLKDPCLDELNTEIKRVIRETILSHKQSTPAEFEKVRERLRNVELVVMATAKWATLETKEIDQIVESLRIYVFAKLSTFLLESTIHNEDDQRFTERAVKLQNAPTNAVCPTALSSEKDLAERLAPIEFLVANLNDEISPERKFATLVLAAQRVLELFEMSYATFHAEREEEFIQGISLVLVRVSPPKFWSNISFVEYLIETEQFVKPEDNFFFSRVKAAAKFVSGKIL